MSGHESVVNPDHKVSFLSKLSLAPEIFNMWRVKNLYGNQVDYLIASTGVYLVINPQASIDDDHGKQPFVIRGPENRYYKIFRRHFGIISAEDFLEFWLKRYYLPEFEKKFGVRVSLGQLMRGGRNGFKKVTKRGYWWNAKMVITYADSIQNFAEIWETLSQDYQNSENLFKKLFTLLVQNGVLIPWKNRPYEARFQGEGSYPEVLNPKNISVDFRDSVVTVLHTHATWCEEMMIYPETFRQLNLEVPLIYLSDDRVLKFIEHHRIRAAMDLEIPVVTVPCDIETLN